MNKKGFTLVEVLAVIVIIGIVAMMASSGVMKVRENSLKKLLNSKIEELEASAILYGQENQGSLEGTCTVDEEEHSFCKLVTVKFLIDEGYYTTSEENKDNKKDLINNITNKSMLCDEVQIYKKNNRIYAKATNIKSNNENNVCNLKY